jgi:hypothetical protein
MEEIEASSVRPFLNRRPMEPDDPAVEHDEQPTVRPYFLTGGRTRSQHELAFETIVRSTDLAERRISALAFERAKIVHLCLAPHSVAEVSAKLHIPLGVAQVLAGDMVGDGLLTMSQSIGSPADDVSLLKRLINGVRVL